MEVDWHTPLLWAQSITNGRIKAHKHLIPLDLALAEAAEQGNKRIIVEMPPRHGKSTVSSIYMPAWYRCQWPQKNFALWSATGRLAQRFSTHCRDISMDHLSQYGWGLDEGTRRWETWKIAGTPPNCGEFYASGVGGGTIMGVGGHFLGIDDFFKNVEDALSETIRTKQHEWYLSCVQTRMEPGASIVIIATRWHRDDLIGFVLREAMQTGEQWHRIRMKAIDDETGKALWPERFPLEALEKTKRSFEISGYPWMWQALYQQEPPEVLDSEWDPSYFHDGIYFDDWPPEERTVFRLVTLDPSIGETEKADYSAIVCAAVDVDGHFWIQGDLEIRDVIRQASAAALYMLHFKAAAFGCEANGFQSVLSIPYADACARLGVLQPMWPLHTSREKRTRIRGWISPHLSAGRLHFRRNHGGTSLLLEQLRGFPVHKHDDGPDALAMAIELATRIRSGQGEPQETEVVTT